MISKVKEELESSQLGLTKYFTKRTIKRSFQILVCCLNKESRATIDVKTYLN